VILAEGWRMIWSPETQHFGYFRAMFEVQQILLTTRVTTPKPSTSKNNNFF